MKPIPSPLSPFQTAALMAVSIPAGEILGMPVRIIPKECLPPGKLGFVFDAAGNVVTLKEENQLRAR